MGYKYFSYSHIAKVALKGPVGLHTCPLNYHIGSVTCHPKVINC